MFDVPVYPDVMPNTSTRFGFPVREDILTTNQKGKVVKLKMFQSAEKILTHLAPTLRRILEPDEVVLYATSGMDRVFAADIYTRMYFTTRIICTDRRMLIMNAESAKANAGWRGNIQSLRWAEITDFRSGIWGGTRIFVNGSAKPIRVGMGQAMPKLKALISILLERARTQGSRNEGMVSLCPRCVKTLTPDVYTCPHCGLQFKEVGKLKTWSLFPGGANFYSGMTGLGILHGLSETIAALFLLFGIFMFASGEMRGEDGEAAVGFLFFAAMIAYVKITAYYTARVLIRKHIPVDIKAIRALDQSVGGVAIR